MEKQNPESKIYGVARTWEKGTEFERPFLATNEEHEGILDYDGMIQRFIKKTQPRRQAS